MSKLFHSLALVVVWASSSLCTNFYPIDKAPEELLQNATWIFSSAVLLPVSIDECWDIITDDDAWQYWHPEVTKITNTGGVPGSVGSSRTIVYDDWLLNLFSIGPIKFEEQFDIWEDVGNYRRYSFYFSGATRPECFTWTAAREELVCERWDDSKSLFGRTVAIEPGSGQQTLSFVVYPRLKRTFEELCPQRMVESIEGGPFRREVK